MNIGVDFDGVLIDSEYWSKFYADYWSEFELGKHRIKNDTTFQQECFDWTKEETEKFLNVVFSKITLTCPFIVGSKEILEKLKQEGHKLYLITRRGFNGKKEIEDAKSRLKELNVKFDSEHWYETESKLDLCKKYKIDVMIDDSVGCVKQFAGQNINLIKFKGFKIDLIEDNIFYADDWFEIYEIIKNLNKNV